MVFSDHFNDREADATTAILGGIVKAENFGLFVVLDAMPGILDFSTHSPCCRTSYRQRSTARHGIESIDGKIQQRLLQLGIIAIDPKRCTVHLLA